MDFDGLKETIIQMLDGTRCPADTDIFQNDMTNIRCRDDVLTLLAHLGYLAYDEESKSVLIPNEEIRHEFLLAVKYSDHTEIANLVKESDELLKHTLNPITYKESQEKFDILSGCREAKNGVHREVMK